MYNLSHSFKVMALVIGIISMSGASSQAFPGRKVHTSQRVHQQKRMKFSFLKRVRNFLPNFGRGKKTIQVQRQNHTNLTRPARTMTRQQFVQQYGTGAANYYDHNHNRSPATVRGSDGNTHSLRPGDWLYKMQVSSRKYNR